MSLKFETASALFATCLLLTSCGNGGGGGGGESASAPVGSLATDPTTQLSYVVASHHGGGATSVRLLDLAWGRLVDIYDFDDASGASRLICRDFVIDPTVISDGTTVRLDTNPFLERESLTILALAGSAAFEQKLAQLDAGMQPVIDKSLDPTELPPFTAVPRNAVLVLVFDDLLDDGGHPGDPTYPGTVSTQTVRIATGYPASQPFEARVFPDPCHGDVVGGSFHSTRVIIDPSVSSTEALATGLEVNTLGLPAAVTTAQPNVALRVPTHVAQQAQQFDILRNLGGKGVAFTGNGPSDGTTPTLDVVRALRSGGNTNVTGDLDNGFLADVTPPELLLTQPIDVLLVQPVAAPTSTAVELELVLQFATTSCAFAPRQGDIVQLASGIAEVIEDYTAPVNNGVVTGLLVRMVTTSPAALIAGEGELKTRWTSALGVAPECALRFLPPANDPPAAGVPLDAQVVLTFSEPIDPASVGMLDSFSITYDAPPFANAVYERVVGHIAPSLDLRRYAFQPALPLRHLAGEATAYTLNLGGITDLAGNVAAIALPPTHFSVDPNAQVLDTGSISLGFSNGDEDGNGAPEVRGQFLYDFARGVIHPRPVAHFSAVADRSVPMVAAMGSPAPPRPIQTPLSNHGSRAMLLWRYCDFGFGLLDEQTHNLDLEGMSWEPFNGQTIVDHFSQFQMAAAHSGRLPDEALNLGLPMFPGSGLLSTFDHNLLDPDEDPLTVIHPMARGYTVNPSETFLTSTGTPMSPWPLNRNIPSSDYSYWTWRDTSKLAVGGPDGAGADPLRLLQVTKVGDVGFYPPDSVPTIGLPLLMDFRSRPDATASGQNGFRIAIALGSSANPFFRTFSTGYVPCGSTKAQDIDPDTAIEAAGGYDPVLCQTTPSQDDAFYFSQADFVVRISRAHTVWFDALGASSFADAVIEPGLDDGPEGTQILLAFRTAASIGPLGSTGWHDASNYDAYGDSYTAAQLPVFGKSPALAFTPTFNLGKTWKPSLAGLPGASFVQVRVSFLSNPLTGLSPELSALGLAFRR